MRKIKIDKEELKSLYHSQLLSLREIAKIYDCDAGVILRNLRKYGFPVRHPTRKIKISKRKLEKLYTKKSLSTYKIAKLFNCDPKTIYRRLQEYKIPTRPQKKVKINKNRLQNLYVNKRLSLAAIGKLYECNQVTVLNKMMDYNLPRRTPWETAEKHPKFNFSGDLVEKAYLLGFRAGDLGVRRRSKITGTIHVGCNSTKAAQIELIKDLFIKYGPVWIGKLNKRGVRSVDILLNSSFSFLLPKKDKINNWILKSKRLFAAYSAGYTDAEGSFGVYDNRAKFRIGSYDIGILKDIANTLSKQKIKNLLRLERKKGTKTSRGVIQNNDFWRITINEKKSLLGLFNLIGSYLKHSDRIEAMEKAIRNVKEREKRNHG